MQIETLDKALSVSNKIAQLESVKQSILDNPGFSVVITEKMADIPEAVPSEEMMNDMEVFTTQFNEKWVQYIDSQISVLQDEFEAL